MLITGNVVRALQRIKADANAVEYLADPEYHETILNMLNTLPVTKEELDDFDLQTEFKGQYKLIKTAMENIVTIETKEDLDILKEAQKFLTFILRNQEKLNDIQAIQAFKEAVIEVLDAEDPKLQDRVIKALSGK